MGKQTEHQGRSLLLAENNTSSISSAYAVYTADALRLSDIFLIGQDGQDFPCTEAKDLHVLHGLG